MEIKIFNCNNIGEGTIEIVEGALNIKYAINGTGKSTVAKAISFAVNKAEDLKQLMPFKYLVSEEPGHQPRVEGIDGVRGILMFDESYVNQYVFQPDEIVSNSFDIFVRTQNYESHMQEIERLVQGIRELIKNNPDLDELLNDLVVFIDGFGKTKSGYSTVGMIGKAFKRGNKIENIPIEFEDYRDYLRSSKKVKWLKWQVSGNDYLGLSDKCPYCTSDFVEKKEKILKIGEEYDAKSLEHLDKILELLQRLSKYLSDDTKNKIEQITKNPSGLSEEQISFLKEVKGQAEILREKLEQIKYIGFGTLKDVDKVVMELESYKVDLDFLSHMNSEHTKSKVGLINSSLSAVLTQAGMLQGQVNQQKQEIERTIERYHKEINSFLDYAGYKYKVSIEPDEQGTYKMKLRHTDSDSVIDDAKSCLSYGERNAFALVLFMYNALRQEPDLVILDDPVSSFDGNKKFAILNMLFLGRPSLKNRTVLMLTHEFNSVIDSIYVLHRDFSPKPRAAFLENRSGLLLEKEISKSDIKSFHEIATSNIQNLNNDINKLVYLRRLLEIEDSKGVSWNLLSNLFHKRAKPTIASAGGGSREMTVVEIEDGTKSIQKYVCDFDYLSILNRIMDDGEMIRSYQASTNNYEKLQLYRIIASGDRSVDDGSSDVVKKFINETYHIENDYLFQLNPCEYEIVPEFIIKECDDYICELAGRGP